jgi:hypothetical protein
MSEKGITLPDTIKQHTIKLPNSPLEDPGTSPSQQLQ